MIEMGEMSAGVAITSGIMSAKMGRRTLFAAVIVLIGTSVITQAFVQFAGGPRGDSIDLTDQIKPVADHPVIIYGLDPFISSGGVYEPEKTIFTIGLSLSGVLFMLVGVDFGVRTHRLLKSTEAKPWRMIANILGIGAAISAGFGMIMITFHPFNISLVMHIFYAMQIFYSGFFWVLFSFLARSATDDKELKWQGYRITKIRKVIVAIVFVSLIGTIYGPSAGYMLLGAFFEWILLFSAMAGMLSNLPAYDEGRIIPLQASTEASTNTSP